MDGESALGVHRVTSGGRSAELGVRCSSMIR
jgi:hypothetical protein